MFQEFCHSLPTPEGYRRSQDESGSDPESDICNLKDDNDTACETQPEGELFDAGSDRPDGPDEELHEGADDHDDLHENEEEEEEENEKQKNEEPRAVLLPHPCTDIVPCCHPHSFPFCFADFSFLSFLDLANS